MDYSLPEPTDAILILNERMRRAQRALQSGVGMDQVKNAETPKHLRVGVNSALCFHTGLVRLLVTKGLLTWEEALEAECVELEAEVRRYEEKLSQQYQTVVKLR